MFSYGLLVIGYSLVVGRYHGVNIYEEEDRLTYAAGLQVHLGNGVKRRRCAALKAYANARMSENERALRRDYFRVQLFDLIVNPFCGHCA